MFTENVYRAVDRGQKAKMTDKVSDRKRIKEENAMKFTEGYWLRSDFNQGRRPEHHDDHH